MLSSWCTNRKTKKVGVFFRQIRLNSGIFKKKNLFSFFSFNQENKSIYYSYLPFSCGSKILEET